MKIMLRCIYFEYKDLIMNALKVYGISAEQKQRLTAIAQEKLEEASVSALARFFVGIFA